MDISELREILSAEGLRLLDSLPPYESAADVLKSVTELRKAGHSPAMVAAVLSQSKLRGRGEAKFGPFASRMLFTEAGLEQATRLQVAALHAGRFRAAGVWRVVDLGCGIGGDAMAMAALELEVTAVERDEVTAAIAAYNLAPWPNATVVNADATDIDVTDFDAVFLDPARRTSGHSNTSRVTNPADYSPSLDFAFATAATLPTGIKLGPGIDRDLIPRDAEAQWVSVDRDVVELGLWFGTLARPGIRRSALVIGPHGTAELSADADSEDAPTGELGDYLYEPDGAVIRARLIGDLARRLDATMLSDGIAYLSSNSAIETPFATCFRVLEVLPFDERALRKELAARGIGRLEIKKRGVDLDPAEFRKRLKLKGDNSATLVVTRVAGRHSALLVERT
ncbi:class I SAM-dependent methyltransferase [Lacisediminihabitans profunda]|uniref:Class I SAM-dependent methyltransferase n=1 Tax=Lacisediminihabitans profunda TaxID=2594790 RepID=A0A5C8UPA2_9MICO|nr:class I SAM-dependent methyltransferase [Lacisediminihabitans profunda]TXN30252.1 class I SAM-dependent methyltransferase [Lacisediminihabitans profunda]